MLLLLMMMVVVVVMMMMMIMMLMLVITCRIRNEAIEQDGRELGGIQNLIFGEGVLPSSSASPPPPPPIITHHNHHFGRRVFLAAGGVGSSTTLSSAMKMFLDNRFSPYKNNVNIKLAHLCIFTINPFSLPPPPPSLPPVSFSA